MVSAPERRPVCELGSRLPGRGAHCCFDLRCVSRLARSNRLEAALRTKNLRVDADALVQDVRGLLGQNLRGLLGASRRKGALAAGTDAVLEKIRRSCAGGLFVASDVSAKSLMRLKRASEEFYILPFDMDALGGLLRRKPVGLLFVADSLLAERICLRLTQERAMGGGCGGSRSEG